MKSDKCKIQKKNFFRYSVFVLFFLFSANIFAQNLPDKIRGYKVYKANISVKNHDNKNLNSACGESKIESETFVKVGEPQIVDVSLSGITFEISAEIDAPEQSGTIDFLMFKDFRVNDLAVDVEEYKEPFKVNKNETLILPKPVRIFIGARQTLRGALSEWRDSKDEWTVTGTIFVFGHFKKSFMKFKRVVPVEINLKVKNPVKNYIENTAKRKKIEAESAN